MEFTALFASSGGIRPYDQGFGKPVAWDVDLLAGYRSQFLRKADQTPVLGESFWSVRSLDVALQVMRLRPDILWLDGYNSATYLLGATTQRLRGQATVFREEQTMLHPRRLATTIVKEIGLRALFAGQHAMYVSTENRRWFEHYGVASNRLHSTPYSVDNDFFQVQAAQLKPNRAQLRADFGIADDSGPVVLTVSRLVAKKQPLFLLEAFRRLRTEMRCALLIVGGGPLEAAMRREVVERAIPDVHFAGFINQGDVSRAYAVADTFTLLSRTHETFGVVVAEAMNFGLPVVVSDKVGCGPDLVTTGVNGEICSSTKVESAARALHHTVQDTHTTKRMGEASRARIDSWTQADTLAGILETVNQARPSRSR